ncbi:NarK family nitrate/nitrite MFS transporter [Shewanella nanhaiensis]|uniref:Nitrate/nitrite transporter n=1 Tax=Shewanella nanhaiensis TaxID=2864872 RepID=A0ABS7E1T0_9GAMM|nr:NarK family nitrate/nitrite MFS transporter [Shewanella nanhaiensis]MBW8183520.1 NarK family nitrate/nitrite MFS transporter [Shewanella nanhaiensis]
MKNERFNIFSFSGKMKTLHLSWIAFFITFMVWFNFAPMLQSIAATLNLTKDEVKTLLILNVTLTIPARILIGMLTDKYGPRLMYSGLLAICAIPCFMFALAENFQQAAITRFLLGFIGAGFVIGIRLVSEWFDEDELGIAEGIYGGWGNFGSAAAAFSLPALTLLFDENGWRYAIGLTGIICLSYSVIFYQSIRDTPQGKEYEKSKVSGALEVTSKSDFFLLLLMKIPLYGALALLVWKLSPAGVNMFNPSISYTLYLSLIAIYALDCFQAWRVNRHIFQKPVPHCHRYQFKQVAVLNVLYFATFGSELAVVSMLPLFFLEVFELSPAAAGLVASSYAFMNLMSRPGGGWLSDKFGRKPVLLILTAGLTMGYLLMGLMNSQWSVGLAIIVAMTCSFFVQSGEGAVFAAVPLIKKRLTGQIAGMTGAYGNVGAVCYLVLLSFVDYSSFFLIIALTAAIGFIFLLFMDNLEGKTAEESATETTTDLIDVT